MTLRSSASRGGESGTHLVTAAGEQVGMDDRVEQVRRLTGPTTTGISRSSCIAGLRA
jgi:hypothetical protein